MICPFCLHKKSDIYNSRSASGGTAVWRRRRCLACGKAFTTQENIDPSGIWKVKNSQKTIPYSQAKLAMSILRACDHRGNQDDAVWYLYISVERQLYPLAAQQEQQLTTADIATTTAGILKRFDPVAYVKYMSYHQPIMDAKTLRKHLRKS